MSETNKSQHLGFHVWGLQTQISNNCQQHDILYRTSGLEEERSLSVTVFFLNYKKGKMWLKMLAFNTLHVPNSHKTEKCIKTVLLHNRSRHWQLKAEQTLLQGIASLTLVMGTGFLKQHPNKFKPRRLPHDRQITVLTDLSLRNSHYKIILP